MDDGDVREEEIEAVCDVFAVGQEVGDQIAGICFDQCEDVPVPLSRWGADRTAYVAAHGGSNMVLVRFAGVRFAGGLRPGAAGTCEFRGLFVQVWRYWFEVA